MLHPCGLPLQPHVSTCRYTPVTTLVKTPQWLSRDPGTVKSPSYAVSPDNLGPALFQAHFLPLSTLSLDPTTKPNPSPSLRTCHVPFYLRPSAQSCVPFSLGKPLFQLEDSAESYFLWQVFLELQSESTSSFLLQLKSIHMAVLSPNLFNISLSHQQWTLCLPHQRI